AIEQLKRALELDQSFINAHFYLGQAYERKGMCREAIAEIKKVIDLYGTSQIALGLLGHIYARAGMRDEAKRALEELDKQSKREYVWPYNQAIIHVGLGEKNQAFELLKRSCEDRSDDVIYLKVDPIVDPLRSDSRFADLLRKVGLAPVETFRLASLPPEKPEPESVKVQAAMTLRSESRGPLRRYGLKLGLAIAITVVLAVLGYLLFRHESGSKEPTSSLKHTSFTQLTYESGAEFFPSLSPDGDSMVYASRATGNWDIYLQRVGSRDSINLTKQSPTDDTQPSFSPDGQRIAFRSDREGGGIYLMSATGESVTRLSDFGYNPSWFPEGEQILFGTQQIPQLSTRPSRSQLWTINIKTNERRLISEGDALQPQCSPHRQRIAYWSRPSKAGLRESIWTIPVEGGAAVAVTDGSTTDLNPVWSPDGKYLYFSSSRGGSTNVWRVGIDEKSGTVLGEPEAVTTIGAATSALHLSFSRDGSRLAYVAQEVIRNLRKVTFDPATGKTTGEPTSITRGSLQLWFPDVSPDGGWLSACSRGQQRHIFILRTDGSDLQDLTDDDYLYDGWQRWSPDGKQIVFTSRRSGNYDLWIMNRDGSELRQLTKASGAHYSPWSPDGRMIAYSIHTPKNDCVIVQPDRAWEDQKLEYLPPLSDPSLSFEGWSWSPDGKQLAGIKHLPSGVHAGIGLYDLASKNYDWLTDFGDWPIWLKDNQHLLFVSQGRLFLLDTGTRKYEPILTVTDQDVDIGSAALSPDNRTIYFTYVAAEADIWLMTLH
ncbi:MAG TPA: tetratricopeptide repeat protein, partial [Pyrinomonadaceae bacterium]